MPKTYSEIMQEAVTEGLKVTTQGSKWEVSQVVKQYMIPVVKEALGNNYKVEGCRDSDNVASKGLLIIHIETGIKTRLEYFLRLKKAPSETYTKSLGVQYQVKDIEVADKEEDDNPVYLLTPEQHLKLEINKIDGFVRRAAGQKEEHKEKLKKITESIIDSLNADILIEVNEYEIKSLIEHYNDSIQASHRMKEAEKQDGQEK